jgi:predicted RNase H-like nuclease
MIAGVDGFKKGWITAIDDGGSISVQECETLEKIVKRPGMSVVVVDIPIGLAESGPRKADIAARELLKKRACCVFNAPIRPILDCSGYEEARSVLKVSQQKGISSQGWGIVRKIREVDVLLRSQPDLQGCVREGHPEIRTDRTPGLTLVGGLEYALIPVIER